MRNGETPGRRELPLSVPSDCVFTAGYSVRARKQESNQRQDTEIGKIFLICY